MSELRKAAQQALEALEEACGNRCNAEYNPCYCRAAADNLRSALAQPAQGPVVWINEHGHIDRGWDATFDPTKWTPLYTAPPQRKPLTDEEMCLCFTRTNTSEPLSEGWPGLERFARAIEKAHGIGEDK